MTPRGSARAAAIVLFALLAWPAAGAAAAPADTAGTVGARPAARVAGPGASGRCGTCHPRERVEFAASRHAAEEVRCVDCHGGNDRSLEIAVAHGSGFTGRPARASIPRMCASCHSDEAKMRPYNLPVDQLALYQTSVHGRRLAQGDAGVAVCSDCHGAHDVLPASDPRSRAHPLNVPRTCGACHGDAQTAAGSRTKENVVAAYDSSFHARELYDRGNLRAPTCVSCHGVHGAAPPDFGDVDKVCGDACHTVERRYFSAGPHRNALARAGLPECASCHGHHAIVQAAPARLERACGRCHGADSKQVVLGQRLWTEYRTALGDVEAAAALTATADAIPLNTEDYRARLEVARTYLSEALPAAHSVSEEVVSGFTTRARSVAQEVQSEIHEKLGHIRLRKVLLVVFWFYIVLTIAVLRRFQQAGPAA
jgi:hypothetical protein